jgi:hypothetical protein
MVTLVCAIPNPGEKGAPRGLFYNKDTAEGRRQYEEFKKREDRPGWGIFDTAMMSWREDADLAAVFEWVLKQNGIATR